MRAADVFALEFEGAVKESKTGMNDEGLATIIYAYAALQVRV